MSGGESIKDGTGNGYKAAVTVNNRLKTTGIDLTLVEAATEAGDTYNINSSELTLTTAGESALLYLKNNEATNIVIDSLIVNISGYTGTAGQPTMYIYRNPTAGTLITDETAGEQSNRNYGSSQVLTADIFEGTEGKTATGQTDKLTIYLPSNAAVTLVSFETIVVLPPGACIALAYKPPTGITTMKIIAALNVTLNGTQL